jgi:hypothetical protein
MSRRDPAVGFVSLGCPKAFVDSERILTQLRAEGHTIVPNQVAALVVVGTCSFIDARSSSDFPANPRPISGNCSISCAKPGSTASACSRIRRSMAHARTRCRPR